MQCCCSLAPPPKKVSRIRGLASFHSGSLIGCGLLDFVSLSLPPPPLSLFSRIMKSRWKSKKRKKKRKKSYP